MPSLRTAALSGVLCALLALPACSKESTQDAPPAAALTKEAPAEAPAETTAEATTAGEEGTVYGDGVTETEAVPMATLLDDPAAYAGKTVRVEGTVTDVCPKRGCWFEMAGEQPGQKLRFKVQDGVMVFPMDAKGKHAVAQGVVHLQELSLEQTREYLAYQAKEYGKDVDPESVTEPMTIVRLDGTGALLRDPE
ncbi:DUF4920 domain-containing protein [Haliangium sp.]|uniref:DUF4920 domain-containing protein n=1 Tax=Haliangium sp. TaxID=2663208 RepID=UPI003D11C922